jgi:Glycine/serine hydroxymethyltransferase
VIAAKAVALKEAAEPEFAAYARQVIANARALAGELTERGFSIVSGGTDSHLMLVDLRNRGLTGKAAEAALGAAQITVNKNTVPGETQSPFVTSGIRIGSSAVTTRGMKEDEMRRIGALIDRVLSRPDDEANIRDVNCDVRRLTAGFPLYFASDEAAARL